jgi:hypothetical protein
VVKNLVKNNQLRPEWIELGCQIDALEERTARHQTDFSHRYNRDKVAVKAPASARLEHTWRRFWRLLWQGSDNRLRRTDPLEAFNRNRDVALARYAAILHETNAKIRRFNRLTPVVTQQRNLIPAGERLQQFAAQFPHLGSTAGGDYAPLHSPVPPYLLQPSAKPLATGPDATRRLAILSSIH